MVVTERSRGYELGWITKDRMANTIELTEAGGEIESDLSAAAVFTNKFNGKIPAPE